MTCGEGPGLPCFSLLQLELGSPTEAVDQQWRDTNAPVRFRGAMRPRLAFFYLTLRRLDPLPFFRVYEPGAVHQCPSAQPDAHRRPGPEPFVYQTLETACALIGPSDLVTCFSVECTIPIIFQAIPRVNRLLLDALALAPMSSLLLLPSPPSPKPRSLYSPGPPHTRRTRTALCNGGSNSKKIAMPGKAEFGLRRASK